MTKKSDATQLLYEFALELEESKYDRQVLDAWMKRYSFLATRLLDFYVDEVRVEELPHSDVETRETFSGIKASGMSKLRDILVRRNNGAIKRA